MAMFAGSSLSNVTVTSVPFFITGPPLPRMSCGAVLAMSFEKAGKPEPVASCSSPELASALPLHPAAAADPRQLVGKWGGEKAANGNRMVFEFTPTTIASYGIDSTGKRLGDVTPARDVSYKDRGDAIAIEFKDGSGITASIKDAKTIVLNLPGMGTRELTRLAR